ncbi:SDR family oxidoreductase [Maribrevibacterium harenarium]|uniref:SDR family oxidoreductase n=1 Tax=Maribrevibacterium harenarium TaxID=2589817 RepID=A0A501WMP9_9GAMM|nr:SDR family oxidoreductase [Maribrevibacterium harenarium]TPE49464.1 SDR family oxidoreductase [Maribrevibacterium harenarium]
MLTNKIIVVTGASRGIGLCITETLLREGALVVAQARNQTPELTQLNRQYPGRLLFVAADLTVSSEIDQLWQSAEAWQGNVDVLVNNAGLYVDSPIDDTDKWQQGWAINLQVNLLAAADLTRHALLHFKARKQGIIVNMASRSSHRGDDAEHLAYGAAKGGLLALTKGIARGYGEFGILAYALAPGWVRTNMAEAFIAEVGEEEVCKNLPLREVTPPQDVAELVAFLSSGRCRHATGSTIDITGADYVR